MRTIDLDASYWKTKLDFYRDLFAAIGAPKWHGESIDALIDSMVWGGVNEVALPYTVRVFGTAKLPKDVRDHVELVRHHLTEACAYFRNQEGHDLGLRFETYP